MKNVFTYLTIAAFLTGSAVSAQVVNREQIVVEPGATLVIEKGGLSNVDGGKVNNQGLIDLQDGNWLNDSNSVYDGGGDLKFSGNDPQTIEHYMHAVGNDTIGFLIVDKPSGDLHLRSDILLTKNLIMSNGDLWLYDSSAVAGYGGNIEIYGTTSFAPGTRVITSNEDASRQYYLIWKNIQSGSNYVANLGYYSSLGTVVERDLTISPELASCCLKVALTPGVYENPELRTNEVTDDVITSTVQFYSATGGTFDLTINNDASDEGTDFAQAGENVSGLIWKDGASTSYDEKAVTDLGSSTYFLDDFAVSADTTYYYVLADEESDLIEGLILSMTAWLQGPYSSGAMSNALRTSELIPASAADNAVYGSGPWNYDGSESVATSADLPANAVDWVLIELRDAPTAADATASTTEKTVAGIILTDGSIVGTNGNPISIKGLDIQNNLYVVLRHRNHLDVMSAGNLTTNAQGEFFWDFTESNSAYGTNALADLGNGEHGMIAGDVSGDDEVSLIDRNNTWNERNQLGYLLDDANLDGECSLIDRNTTWNNRNKIAQKPQ